MQLREKQLNLKRNPLNPTENYFNSQYNSKYTKILNQLEKFDITHDSLKSLSKKIFDLDTLELLDEKKIPKPFQINQIEKETLESDLVDKYEDDLIDISSKLQKEKLNRSFDLLIKESKKLNNNDKFEMNTAEVQKKTMLFNESIKAYVDVCCQTPGLVS